MFLERCYLLRTPPAELRQKKNKKTGPDYKESVTCNTKNGMLLKMRNFMLLYYATANCVHHRFMLWLPPRLSFPADSSGLSKDFVFVLCFVSFYSFNILCWTLFLSVCGRRKT